MVTLLVKLRRWQFLLTLFCILILFGTLTQRAWAHQSIPVGDYLLEYRWLHEPPLAGQENAIFLGVRLVPATHTVLGKLTLVTPTDGMVINGDLLPVSVHIEQAGDPGQVIHWHIYVDDQMVLMPNINQPTVALQGISNGPHTLKVTLSGADHKDVGDPVLARIVVQGAAGSGEITSAQPTATPDPKVYTDVDLSSLQVKVATGQTQQILPVVRVDSTLPGQYMAAFTPQQSGIYTVALTGQMAGSVVNSQVTLERVREPTVNQRLSLLLGLRTVRLGGIAVIALLVVWGSLRLGRRQQAPSSQD